MPVSVHWGISELRSKNAAVGRFKKPQGPEIWLLVGCITLLIDMPSDASAQVTSEIVVTGKRQGAAAIDPEFELDEDEIAARQVDSVAQLVRRISPLIGGTDDEPVLIVNGKRIADSREIAGYPPAALQRAEVLPRGAAAFYGYPTEKRVVNLVLKQKFDSRSVEGGVSIPTAGGRDSETLWIRKTVIAGDTRWNIEGKLDRSSKLLQADRTLPPSRDMLLFGDDSEYRTLLPSTASASLNASLVHPVGAASLSLSFRAGKDSSLQWLGLPQVDLQLRQTSPYFDPARSAIYRLWPQAGATTARQTRNNVGLSVAIHGPLFGLNASLSVGYDHNEARSLTIQGYSRDELYARAVGGAPALNTFGSLPVGGRLDDRTRSASDSLSAGLALNASIRMLPAGPSTWTITANMSSASSSSYLESFGTPEHDSANRKRGDVRLGIALPLTSRRSDFLALLGDITINLSAGASVDQGATPTSSAAAALTWSPAKTLNLNIQANIESEAPSVTQLTAPVVQTKNVRIYDFARGELAEITRIDGGNSGLGGGFIHSWSIGGAVHAFGSKGPFLTFDYRHRENRGGVGALPTLTSVVEAAFSDRIVRDAEGHLAKVDNRPINFVSETQQSFRSSLSANILLGHQSPPRAPVAGGWHRPGSVNIMLSHDMLLRNMLLIKDGIPPLDRLKGQGGGQSRHVVKLQVGLNVRGMGLVSDTLWQSAYRTLGGAKGPSLADLYFKSWLSSNLELRLYPSTLDILGRPRWLEDTRFGIAVDNFFDTRRVVIRADGSIPPGYSRNEVDPLGRVVRLSVRRSF